MLTVVFLLLVTGAVAEQSKHDVLSGHQVWEVENSESFRNLRSTLMNLEFDGKIDILGVTKKKTHFRVFPKEVDFVAKQFQKQGIKTKLVVRDLKSFLENQHKLERNRAHSRKTSDVRCTEDSCSEPLINEYMTFDEIEYYLSSIRTKNPSRIKVTSIGKTEEGRDIWMVNIKSDTVMTQRGMFIEGGVHAREWISSAVTLHLIKYLIENPEVADGIEFNIVPMGNPDGYVYTHTTDRMWRKNMAVTGDCKGVDLNRNWDYKWGIGASNNTCSDTYRGPSPFSEPETSAISKAIENTPNLKFVLCIHSYGQILLYPWGWTTDNPPNVSDLITMGKKITEAIYDENGVTYEVANTASRLYYASGTTDDWAKGFLKVKYVYTIELRDKGLSKFLLPAKQIRETSAEIWRGLKSAIAKIKKENV